MRKAVCLIILLLLFATHHVEARLYFIHVPKTGGTTLRLLLEIQLSLQEIYPYRNHKSAVEPVKENLVSGHFSYWFCKKQDDSFGEAFKVTILREPVERYLSFLRAKKKADKNLPDLESVLRLREKRKSIYKEELVDNALCRYLAESPGLEGEALLESAKRTLREFDCVIFFEHFEKDVIDLFQRLGIELDIEDIPKINTTEPEPVGTQLLEEVRRLNELDIQLYGYAKEQLGKKNNRYSLRTSSFETITRKTSLIDYTFDFPLCGRGWTYREEGEKAIEHPIYRWVMDYPATINFSLEEGCDYLLFFNAWSLTEEIFPEVKVNEKEIEIIRLNTDKFSLYRGIVPKEWITQHPTEIKFFSNKALQFRDVYPCQHNRNHPPLSFAINRIQIQESSSKK